MSRNGNEFKSFGSLNAAIADQLKGHSAVLDSEIVSLDNDGKSQFYDLFFHRGEARLCAFDVPSICCGATVIRTHRARSGSRFETSNTASGLGGMSCLSVNENLTPIRSGVLALWFVRMPHENV